MLPVSSFAVVIAFPLLLGAVLALLDDGRLLVTVCQPQAYEGEYSDNGVVRTVKPGDVTWTPDGSSHGVENKGDTELTFMALIINK